MRVIVLVYFNKIISLPAPLLYCVFNRFVLLHKIPNICRFYPCFSMLFRFSICQSFVLLTVRPLNQNTTDAQRKPERMGGKSLSGCRLELVRSLGRANSHIWKLASPNDSNLCIFENSNKGFRFSTARMCLDF